MSAPRISFIDILETEFKNPKIKEKICELGLKSLKNGLATRVFDNFPPLVDEKDIVESSEKFRTLLSKIKSYSETQHGLEPTLTEDKNRIYTWQIKIISMAMTELLNEDRQLKPRLIELLGWEPYEHKFQKWELISAFVGAINQQIMNQTEKYIKQNMDAYNAICGYINKNNKTWVKKALSSSDYTFISKYEKSKMDDVLRWPTGNISPGILLVLSAVTAASAGYMLFRNNARQEGMSNTISDLKLINEPLRLGPKNGV